MILALTLLVASFGVFSQAGSSYETIASHFKLIADTQSGLYSKELDADIPSIEISYITNQNDAKIKEAFFANGIDKPCTMEVITISSTKGAETIAKYDAAAGWVKKERYLYYSESQKIICRMSFHGGVFMQTKTIMY